MKRMLLCWRLRKALYFVYIHGAFAFWNTMGVGSDKSHLLSRYRFEFHVHYSPLSILGKLCSTSI